MHESLTKVGVPEVRRHDTATVHDYVSSSPSLNAALAVCVPNAFMLMQHYRGKTGNLVNLVLRTTGVYGLFALPFIGLFMEKSFYGECNLLPRVKIKSEEWGCSCTSFQPLNE